MLLSVVANRVGMALLTLAGVAVIVFVLLRVVPGDPVAMMISPGASPADIAALKAHYGLDAQQHEDDHRNARKRQQRHSHAIGDDRK